MTLEASKSYRATLYEFDDNDDRPVTLKQHTASNKNQWHSEIRNSTSLGHNEQSYRHSNNQSSSIIQKGNIMKPSSSEVSASLFNTSSLKLLVRNSKPPSLRDEPKPIKNQTQNYCEHSEKNIPLSGGLKMLSNHDVKKPIKHQTQDYYEHAKDVEDDIPLSVRLQMLSNHDDSIQKRPISEVQKEWQNCSGANNKQERSSTLLVKRALDKSNCLHSSAKKSKVSESDRAASIKTIQVSRKSDEDIARPSTLLVKRAIDKSNCLHSSAKTSKVSESGRAASIKTIQVSRKSEEDIAIIKKVAKELESKERQFEARMKVLESKEKQFEERVKGLSSKEKQFECRVKEFESKENKFEEQVKGLRRKERQFEGQVKELESKERKFKDRVKGLESKENNFEVLAMELNSKEKQFECRVKEFESKENKFEEQVKGLRQKERQFEGQVKELEPKERKFKDRVKELESKENKFEVLAKELNSKAKQFECRVKEFESKENKFEEQVKQLRRKERQFEGQVKELDSKERKFEDRVKELNSKENNFDVLANELYSKEKQFEEQVKKLKFNEKQFEVQVKEHGSREKQFEGQVKDVESKEKQFEGQVKEFESKENKFKEQVRELERKERQFEGRAKELESKEKKFEGRMKELRSKENSFEEQVKELNSKEKQFEGQRKELEFKEKKYEVHAKELESNERHFGGRVKDLDSKRSQYLKQLKEIELKAKQYETLIKSFQEEKLPDKQSSLTTYVQTNETELLSNSDSLVILKTSSDPAKLVLDIIKNPVVPQCRKGDNAVIVDKWQIFLLEQLMRLSPHIKPYVRDEAKKLALDLEANIRASTAENSVVVLGFLLLLTIYGLVSCFKEGDVLNLFEFVAQHKQAVELFRTLGFVDKVSDFVQNLIKKQKHIEAVGFICAYKLVETSQPIDLLQEHVQNVRLIYESSCKETKSFEIKVKAIDEAIASLECVLQCISDNNIESQDLHKEIQDRILELESQANCSISTGIRTCIQKCNNKNYF